MADRLFIDPVVDTTDWVQSGIDFEIEVYISGPKEGQPTGWHRNRTQDYPRWHAAAKLCQDFPGGPHRPYRSRADKKNWRSWISSVATNFRRLCAGY